MAVRHVSCGEFVTEGERKAFARLKNALEGLSPRGAAVGVRGAGTSVARPVPSSGDDDWLIFTNLNHVYDQRRRPDEIDMVVIGPTGAFVIEVKPWEHVYLDRNPDTVNRFAILTNDKARRIKGTLESVGVNVFVIARVLLTADSLRLDRPTPYAGVDVGGLAHWRSLLNVGGERLLDSDALNLAEQALHPAGYRRRRGLFRSIGEIEFGEDDQVVDDAEAPFHRIWRGHHRRRQDRVIVHIYDLSAKSVSNERADALAARDFEAIQHLQHLDFVPRIYDSFSDHPEYLGDIKYFSLIDTLATPIVDRQDDPTWTLRERLDFALATLGAVEILHRPKRAGVEPIIHRSLNPGSVRVLSSNSPMLVDFKHARIPGSQTISSRTPETDWGLFKLYVAPEVRQSGLREATYASDTYSICATLKVALDPDLFPGGIEGIDEREIAAARAACDLFEVGKRVDPGARPTVGELVTQLEESLRHLDTPSSVAERPPLHPDLWDQAHEVSLGDSWYRVVERLGAGGIGKTFKVVELDLRRRDELGTYVAKTINEANIGEEAIRAYRLAKQHTVASQHIATIHEVAGTWSESAVMCLIEWIDGRPLKAYVGKLEIELADRSADFGGDTVATLLLQWMQQICEGLQALHRVNLVHGDVSPQNIMARGEGLFEVQLTDFDTVIEEGQEPRGRNPMFACQEIIGSGRVAKSDDVFALAASAYHILTDRTPFEHDAVIDRSRGLGWLPDDPWSETRGFSELRQVLDRATDPTRAGRFADAFEAADAIVECLEASKDGRDLRVTPPPLPPPPPPPPTLREQTNERLRSLLAMYPGSRHGNAEARGLDSDFARQTYVESRLDTHMLQLVERNEVSLILLFGNAGDGKTAFLQYLAARLSPGAQPVSADHVWRGTVEASGLPVLINLDGSASGDGRSADQMLDEVFGHFHHEGFVADRVHMVAVNSGKLLDWIENTEAGEAGETWLTRQLRVAMGDWAHDGDDILPDSRIRLIDLNDRSLVGGTVSSGFTDSGGFFDQLVDRLVGADDAWQVCKTCVSQDRCPAYGTVRAMQEEQVSGRIRARLREALQACHQRGVVHITSRELRGSLSYVLFGNQTCEEIHAGREEAPVEFWNRAFDAAASGRTHPLLAELASLDPGIECDPATDRKLVQALDFDSEADASQWAAALRDARRRSWFMDADANGEPTVSLVSGRSQRRFRNLASMQEDERLELLADLCEGLARIEDLPEQAFRSARQRVQVPIRISPRTPTETILWTATRLDRFRVEARVGTSNADLFDQLHTTARLSYHDPDGRPVATLSMGLELFDVLLRAERGEKLTNGLQEGHNDNLSAFSERLAREGAREVLAWHPSEPDHVFRVRAERPGERQVITLGRLTEGDDDAE